MSRYGPAGGYPDQPGDPHSGRWTDPYSTHRGGHQGGGWEGHQGGREQDQSGWEGHQGGWEQGPPPHPGQPYPPQQPGQPYPPQAGEPYPRHQYGGGDPYRPPADPWGQGQDSWADLTRPQPAYHDPQETQTYPQPAPHRSPYPPGGAGGQHWEEGPPPPRRRRVALVALVAVLVLLVAGGLAAVLFWISGDDQDPAAAGAGQPTATDGAEADEDGDDGPEDRIGMGAVVAEADDCLVNDSTDDDPVMRIVPCDTEEDTRVYLVLSRVDEQIAGETAEEQDSAAHEICGEVEGYEYHYRFVGPSEEDSFVLCMREE